MPGACQTCLGPYAVRKWAVSSGPALVPAHQPLCVPKAHGHQGSAFYPTVMLLQASCPKKCLPHPKTSNTGPPSAPCWGRTSHFDHKPLLREHQSSLSSPAHPRVLSSGLRGDVSLLFILHCSPPGTPDDCTLFFLCAITERPAASCKLLALWSGKHTNDLGSRVNPYACCGVE